MNSIILEMRGITKLFPGVRALSDVSIQVQRGEIHAIVGENGAGKSTLMNILSGVYPCGSYEGDIYFNGELCRFKDIKESEKKGIAIIHQELALSPNLSAAENVFLGNERAKCLVIDWDTTRERAHELLTKVGYKRGVDYLVKNLSVSEQQLVEIAKALSKDVKLLILDEPTSALNEIDAGNLLKLLVQLKDEGITSIIISHKLNEIKQIADSITILRDGRIIETLENRNRDTAEDYIIRGMVGRDIPDIFPKRKHAVGETLFEVKEWRVFDPFNDSREIIHNVNIAIGEGEVVGISGLMGAGRTEFALSVFGRSYGTKISGQVFKSGAEINMSTVSRAIENGVAYVTEDRKEAGLILSEDIVNNTVLVNLWEMSSNGLRNKELEVQATNKEIDNLNIKCTGAHQKTMNLSGGNQQKVVLAKWILSSPEVLILDEPTRGIDVGAKREVYSIINRLAETGKAILFISSEMPELLGMCDRLYVMNMGRIVGELHSSEFSQEAVMECIMRSNLSQ